MKILKLIIWVICTLVTISVFYLLNISTALPNSLNGNGNPAALLLYICSPAILYFYIMSILYTSEYFGKIGKLNKVVFLFVALIIGVLLIFPIKYKASIVREGLGVSSSADYSEGWNQFTNNVYFNLYTFLLSIVICIFISLVIKLVKRNK